MGSSLQEVIANGVLPIVPGAGAGRFLMVGSCRPLHTLSWLPLLQAISMTVRLSYVLSPARSGGCSALTWGGAPGDERSEAGVEGARRVGVPC